MSLDSPAINAAIDRAYGQGRGLGWLSPGVYLCGRMVLKNNVTLYLEAGATLLGSKDVKQYIPQAGPSENADASTLHLIFAKGAEILASRTRTQQALRRKPAGISPSGGSRYKGSNFIDGQ